MNKVLFDSLIQELRSDKPRLYQALELLATELVNNSSVIDDLNVEVMSKAAKRLHGPSQVSTIATTKYVTPVDKKAVITHIHVQNPTGAAAKITISIGIDAAPLRIYDGYSVAANSILDDKECYYPLGPGELIQAFSDTSNVLVLTISGNVS